MFSDRSQEVSYTDFLLLLAENIKLLIIAPFCVALVMVVWGFTRPQDYTSELMFSVIGPASSIALERMESQLVLDKVASSFPMFKGMTKIQAREQLAERIKITFGKDKILILEVTTENPDQSKKLTSAIFDEWMRSDVFGITERADLEQRLAYAKTGLDAVNGAIATIKTSGILASGQNRSLDNSVSLLQPLSDMQIQYLNDMMNGYKALQNVSSLDVKQAPTLPTDANPRARAGLIIRTYFATLAFLVFWLFIRKIWTNAGKDPETARKQALIKAALKF